MEEEKSSKKAPEIKSGGDVFIIRSVVCVIVMLMTLFVRFNNQYIYDSLKFWYKENILEEKYSFEKVSESIEKMCLPVKSKVLDLFSNLKLADK